MLNLSCLTAVASAALIVATLVLLVFPGLRIFARRAAIVSAIAFLSSAAVFAHLSGVEAHGIASDAAHPAARMVGPKLGSL